MRFLDSKFHILIALGLITMSVFAVELFFGLLSRSMAMTTNSLYTLMDAAVIFVSLLVAKAAMRPADEKHTYGYGKLEPMGYLLSGIAVLIVAGFFVYEAVFILQGPTPLPPSLIGIWGGFYAIGMTTFKIYVIKKAIQGFGGVVFKTDLRRSYMDLSIAILTILSIPLSIFGFLLMDAVTTMIIGVILGTLAIGIVYKAALELIDVTSPKMVEDLKAIIEQVPGVIRAGPVLLRRSGDTLLADATAIVRGDTSVDAAHRVSEEIENQVKKQIAGAPVAEKHSFGLSEHIRDTKLTIRVEPDWTDVPIDSKILEIAKNIDDVLDASHASTHKLGDKMYADLRVKVDNTIPLVSTYEISNRIESEIKEQLPGIEHTTIRLEPADELDKDAIQKDANVDNLIRSILDRHTEILGTIKISSLKFDNVYKIDIDCMLDGEKSIEEVHFILTEIEHEIIKEIKNAIVTIHPVPT